MKPQSKLTKVWSVNEWGKLREVILGDPLHAFVPDLSDLSMQSFDRPGPEEFKLQIETVMPKAVIDETLEDLEGLEKTLKEFGVIVHRSELRDFTCNIKSPDWDVKQESGINIRDLTFIHGSMIIDCASPTRNRYFESLNVRSLFNDYSRRDKDCWYMGMPRPLLPDETYDLAIDFGIREIEPLMDAANVARCGSFVIIDINNTANRLGAEWLQQALDKHYGGRKVTVHILDHCAPDHIDVVVVPLCEGVFLASPEYLKKDSIPKALKNWKVIFSPEMMPAGYGIACPKASNWIGMNVLVVDGEEKTVIVEKSQEHLIKVLEQNNFRVIPVRWRHGRTWGGAFHCVTVDTWREGEI